MSIRSELSCYKSMYQQPCLVFLKGWFEEGGAFDVCSWGRLINEKTEATLLNFRFRYWFRFIFILLHRCRGVLQRSTQLRSGLYFTFFGFYMIHPLLLYLLHRSKCFHLSATFFIVFNGWLMMKRFPKVTFFFFFVIYRSVRNFRFCIPFYLFI